ncbi:TPA: N-acetylmuramoyl-L-alanine amidase C-terminal domain-containing protein, partial [Bacillus cereus]
GKFILEPDGLAYIETDPTSDAQLKACEEWLLRLGWHYEVK